MKKVVDVLSQIKGEGNVSKTLTGKGAFSSPAFSSFVNALANDKDFKVKSFDKASGKEIETNISELLVADAKKTVENAKYPQKSEIGVLNTAEIATNGLAKVIPAMVTEWLRTGKKFPLVDQKDFSGSINLMPVKGKTKTIDVRDMKTQAKIGTVDVTTKDSVQVRVKSPVPAHLQTKVRKDNNGKVVTK
jgi:hypothetical protein